MENDQMNELDVLKAQADRLGIRYNSNISEEKLRERVNTVLAEAKDSDTPEDKVDRKTESFRAANELVRVRVTCMDQTKSTHQGVIVTTGNASSGTVSKYVPFDVEWHIPRMLYNVMKETKCMITAARKGKNGIPIVEKKLVNAYNIEELPPLTEAELKDLAQRQAMAKGIA